MELFKNQMPSFDMQENREMSIIIDCSSDSVNVMFSENVKFSPVTIYPVHLGNQSFALI